jgi:hypothetical protein
MFAKIRKFGREAGPPYFLRRLTAAGTKG